MKNRVNLYHLEFHPTLQLLTLTVVILSWVIAAVFCGLLYFYMASEEQALQSKSSKIQQQNKQQKTIASNLQVAVDGQQIDPLLSEQVQKSQQLIRLRKRVFNQLSGQEDLKANGFSDLMVDLARYHQSGLWLTHISLNGMNVVMEGVATNSSIVPKWLSSLGKTDYFKGQKFSDTRIFSNAEQQFNFVISTGKEVAR